MGTPLTRYEDTELHYAEAFGCLGTTIVRLGYPLMFRTLGCKRWLQATCHIGLVARYGDFKTHNQPDHCTLHEV